MDGFKSRPFIYIRAAEAHHVGHMAVVLGVWAWNVDVFVHFVLTQLEVWASPYWTRDNRLKRRKRSMAQFAYLPQRTYAMLQGFQHVTVQTCQPLGAWVAVWGDTVIVILKHCVCVSCWCWSSGIKSQLVIIMRWWLNGVVSFLGFKNRNLIVTIFIESFFIRDFFSLLLLLFKLFLVHKLYTI